MTFSAMKASELREMLKAHNIDTRSFKNVGQLRDFATQRFSLDTQGNVQIKPLSYTLKQQQKKQKQPGTAQPQGLKAYWENRKQSTSQQQPTKQQTPKYFDEFGNEVDLSQLPR